MQRDSDRNSVIIQESSETDPQNSNQFTSSEQPTSKFNSSITTSQYFSKSVKDYTKLNTPKVSLLGFKFSAELNSKVVVYNLEVTNMNNLDSDKYHLERRFRDFYQLSKNLRRNAGNIPAFPSRTLFKVTKNESLEKRRAVLEQWIQSVVQRFELWGCEDLIKFLDVSNIKFINC